MWAWALEDVGKDDADVKWDWVGQRLNGCFSQWLFQPIAVTTCILEAKAVSANGCFKCTRIYWLLRQAAVSTCSLQMVVARLCVNFVDFFRLS